MKWWDTSWNPVVGCSHASLGCDNCYAEHRNARFSGGQLIQSGIDWVICGGESGTQARPMRAAWARSLCDQCLGNGVPFLFKQWGEWLGEKQDGNPEHEPLEMNMTDDPVRVGKFAAGRTLDGRTYDAFPWLQRRIGP